MYPISITGPIVDPTSDDTLLERATGDVLDMATTSVGGVGPIVERFLQGAGELALTVVFVALALALIYSGVTRALDVRPLRTAVDIAL